MAQYLNNNIKNIKNNKNFKDLTISKIENNLPENQIWDA
jgi:hypothetical protein